MNTQNDNRAIALSNHDASHGVLPMPANLPALIPAIDTVLRVTDLLGTIERLYACRKAYEIECHRIATEQVKLREMAKYAHRQIDLQHERAMEALQQRMAEVHHLHETVGIEVQQRGIERANLCRLLTIFYDRACDPGATPAERDVCLQVADGIREDIRHYSQEAGNLANSLMANLPALEYFHETATALPQEVSEEG